MSEDVASKIYKARREIDRLEDEKKSFVKRKAALNNHIAKMKEKEMLGEAQLDYQRKVAGKRKTLKEIMDEVDKRLSEIKKEQKQWRALSMSLESAVLENIRKFGSIYHDGISESAIADRLKNLRDKYMEFSADFTRVNSMRLMAAQFSDEITDILSAA
jgi:hypothetical protein